MEKSLNSYKKTNYDGISGNFAARNFCQNNKGISFN